MSVYGEDAPKSNNKRQNFWRVLAHSNSLCWRAEAKVVLMLRYRALGQQRRIANNTSTEGYTHQQRVRVLRSIARCLHAWNTRQIF